jgi:hypothetical protein
MHSYDFTINLIQICCFHVKVLIIQDVQGKLGNVVGFFIGCDLALGPIYT